MGLILYPPHLQPSPRYHQHGLVGWNVGSINTCYAKDKVHGVTLAGGLVGYHTAVIIGQNYAAAVSGTINLGWLVG